VNFENQYAPHGLSRILKIKALDYRLKCYMAEQKCKIDVTGRKRGDREVRMTPIYLQQRDTSGVADFR